MVVKVIVTGLPRSGTTITYELIARNNHGNNVVYLYEPFTYIVYELFSRYGLDAKLHDYLEVTHNYDRISKEVFEFGKEIS